MQRKAIFDMSLLSSAARLLWWGLWGSYRTRFDLGEDAEDRLHRQTIFIEWDTDGEEQNLPKCICLLFIGGMMKT